MAGGLKTQKLGGKERQSLCLAPGIVCRLSGRNRRGCHSQVQVLLLDPFTDEEGKGKVPGRPNSQLQPSPHKVLCPPSAPFIKHYFKRKA